MSRLQLPTVTLVCVDCVDAIRAASVVNRCKQLVDFADVKLMTSLPCGHENKIEIMPIRSLIAYSVFMLTELHKHIETDHVLVVQRDGWILNPGSWSNEWLNLDYIGPLFMQYDKVGSGGFSLRSKKIMSYFASVLPKWDGIQESAERIQSSLGYYEDGVISMSKQSSGFKIATPEQASMFAQGGNRNAKYFYDKPFGFHRTWQTIDFKTGVVDSADTTKDIHVTYDYEIDTL